MLPDSSLSLLPVRQRANAALLDEYCDDRDSLTSCLQCGVCTVNCQLAETDGALFPRRQMSLLQLGEVDKLLADPAVWLCFNCQDCTSRCPAHAGPGRIMAAIRRLAVDHYSGPRWWSRLANQRRGFLYMVLAAIVFLLVAVAVGGSFSPQTNPVRYASMLPHFTLNLIFGALAVVVMSAAVASAARAWKAFSGETIGKTDLPRLVRSVFSAARQIGAHEQFSECRAFPLSRWAHGAVFYGFLTLMALAAAAAVMIARGATYPLPAFHPFKVVGNLAAAAIIAGSLYFCAQRQRASWDIGVSSWFDWAPLVQLLLVSVTGVLVEVFRYASVRDTSVVWLAYPMYFLHLVFVFVLLAGLPNSKLAHVFYRTVALTAEEYKAAEVPLAEWEPRRMAA